MGLRFHTVIDTQSIGIVNNVIYSFKKASKEESGVFLMKKKEFVMNSFDFLEKG